MAHVKSAIVIGGGIAGPAAALALRKAGIEAIVYEAYPSTAEGMGGMLMVAPNGLNALAVIGLDEAVAAAELKICRDAVRETFTSSSGAQDDEIRNTGVS